MDIAVACGPEHVIVKSLDWDTQILRRKCARIERFEGLSENPDYSLLTLALNTHGFEYVTVRVAQAHFARLHALENCGFRLVDGVMHFSSNRDFPEVSGVRLALASEADQVAELAAKTFTQSRFHNDPSLSAEVARNVHYQWARNSVLGTAADAVLVCEENRRLVAFSTCKIDKDQGSIVLVGVDNQYSGRGLGRKMTEAAGHWLLKKGIHEILIQTQTNNLPATALYMACGFRLIGSSFTLRWQNKN